MLRKNISESQEEAPKIGWSNSKMEKPTTNFVIEAFENVRFERVAETSYKYGFYGDSERFRVMAILNLLGISIDELLDS